MPSAAVSLDASATPNTTIAVSNDLALQSGAYMERYTVKGQKGEMTDWGRYASSMVRGTDGNWRWSYIMTFTDSTTKK